MTGWMADLTGAAAATLTTLCWAPQVIHIARTRDTRAISLVTQIVFAAGVALWLAYGVMLGSWPIMIANALTLALAVWIVAMKLRFG